MTTVTLSMVANAAKVSISTASRVLNNSEVRIPISAKTRERVQQAALGLGYLPSAAARALRKGKSRTISVLGTSPQFFQHYGGQADFFRGEAVNGLLNAAVETGYHLTLLTGTETAAETGGVMMDIGVADGLLVLNRDVQPETKLSRMLHVFPKPFVYALSYPNDPNACVVAPNDTGGGRLATQTLLNAGHRRIGFARMPGFKDIFDRRQRGWAEALQQAGLRPDPAWVLEPLEPNPEQLKATRVTAVVCANLGIARRYKAAGEAMGMSIPGDLSVVAFGHVTHEGTTPFEFSAVVDPLRKIIGESLNMLVQLVEGRHAGPRQQFSEFIFREGSTLAEPRG